MTQKDYKNVLMGFDILSVHSPVPTWGHLSQLRPQALPTVQQHISWVMCVGSGCSQPLTSDAIRKHWACSAGDSERGEMRVLFRSEVSLQNKWLSEWKRKLLLLTNTSISVQHKTRLAGTSEAAQCVQTLSVLTDTLHGALVDIFRGVKMKRVFWYTHTVKEAPVMLQLYINR